MSDDVRLYPAALPTLCLALGIALQAALHNFVLALQLVALLILLSSCWKRRRGMLIASALFLALGVWRGGSHAANEARTSEFVARHSDVAVQVSAPLRRAWIIDEAGASRLRLTDATVTTRGATLRHVELSLFLPRRAPPTGRAATIEAKGFIHRSESGREVVSIKSSEWITYRGEMSRLDPRSWNRALSEALDRLAAERRDLHEEVQLAKGLALGQSAAVPDDVRDSYRRGGTYHLLVFSGMQIAFAAGAVALILLPLQRPRWVDGATLLLAMAAPLFAGHDPSVDRASLMIGLLSFSRLLRRPTISGNLLFVSALLRLLFVPGDLFEAGFQLTYGAAGGLMLVGGELANGFEPNRRFLRLLARGIGAEMAIAPLTMFYFHRFTLAGSVMTLLIAPIITLLLASSILFGATALFVPALAPIPAFALHYGNELTMWLNDFAASSLHLSRLAPGLDGRALGTGFLLVTIAFACPWKRMRSATALVLLILTIASALPRASRDGFSLEMLDVGQGDALLIHSSGRNVLIDGGGIAGDSSFGSRVLIPMLLQRGVTSLDAIALSHPHPDHCGGLADVVRDMKVRELWLAGRQFHDRCSADLFELAQRKGMIVRIVEHHSWLSAGGDLLFRSYTPRLRFKKSSVNNSSVVFFLRHDRRSIVLTGDIERDAETLLTEDGGVIRADVLKVPHHGSRTSSTAPFLAAVSPRVALISCGIENRYGHPHRETVERLRRAAARVVRTDLAGCIRVRIEGNTLWIETEFDTRRTAH